MLINTSHPTSRGQLPPSLLEIYVRYKQDTRAIIAWLMSHGTRKYKGFRTVSIRDLLGLAEIVQTKEVVMPDTIDFCFREAIAARTQLSKLFRKTSSPGGDDQETVNHEYFTTSLTKIYTDLCECCARPKERCKRVSPDRPLSSDSETVAVNRFTVLNLGNPKDDCACTEKTPNRQCEEDREETLTATPRAKATTPRLIDDPLGDAFELYKDIQEMSDLLLGTNSAWEQAARGETPLVVAAFTTNAAFARFEEIEQRLKVLCDGSNPEALRSKFMQIQEDLEVPEGVEVSVHSRKSQQVDALQQSWQLLLQFKRVHQAGQYEKAIPSKQRPSQIILRRGSDSAPTDRECLTMLLQNIGQHVRAIRRPTSVVRIGTPVYADIGYFFTHDEDDTNGLRCSYGLQILLEAYKSYLLASDCACAPPSCRLRALQFAQEAISSIRAVLDDSSMPCRCCHTLAFHLEDLHFDFQAFVQEKVFDLYFQSPWVSGSHVLEMMETLFYYGLRLFSYRHYVGSVMHVYNILRRLTGFQRIPLLEELCNTFDDILFPGGRPSRNFRACCVRYMGGRLRFNPHASDHKSGSHQMAIPAHTARATAGFGLRKEANDSRFEYRKVSLFHHIKQRGYHLDDALWDRVHDLTHTDGVRVSGKSRKRLSCCHHSHSKVDDTSSSPQHSLLRLQKAVLADFIGPFPIAKVNFFEVYTSCVRIVSIISDHAHDEKGSGQNCLCFLEVILAAADRCKDNEHKLQPLGHKELVQTCKDAMSTVLGERGLDDYLWKGI
ncbi:MAG: hypothetical protein M1830_000653 [Pleopsidium flavum]|nr:MAG: hypothetical protein M1830_000653 [Pleopsidium flavum]